MQAAEQEALARGKALLVLDTASAEAERPFHRSDDERSDGHRRLETL